MIPTLVGPRATGTAYVVPALYNSVRTVFTNTVRIGRTSMTIHAAVWAQRRFGDGETRYVTEAQITMVAVNDELKPIPVGSDS